MESVDDTKQNAEREARQAEFRYAPTSRRRFGAFLQRWRSGELQQQGSSKNDTQEEEAPKKVDRALRRQHLKRYAHWLWPARMRIVGVLFLGLIFGALDASWPIAIGWILDIAAPGNGKPLPGFLEGGERLDLLITLTVGCLVVVLISRLIQVWRNVILRVTTSELTQRLRRTLFDRLVHLPLKDLHEMKTGGIQSRLTGDVDATSNLVQQGVISPLTAIIHLLTVVVILLTIDWRLTCISMGLLMVCGLVYHGFVKKIRPVWRVMRKQVAQIDGRLNEVFGGFRFLHNRGMKKGGHGAAFFRRIRCFI